MADDIAFGITHVIRGEDHVTNTGAQIQMFQALDAPVPVFAHLPLLVDAAGGGLSKRTGSLSIADLRAHGIEAVAISALLAHLGRGPIQPMVEDAAFLAEVAGKLPAEPWDETTWKGWTAGLGRKGRALVHPLRLALTSQEKGPEMAKLLPLIGRSRATDRLHGQEA